jgi:hypothetical protein
LRVRNTTRRATYAHATSTRCWNKCRLTSASHTARREPGCRLMTAATATPSAYDIVSPGHSITSLGPDGPVRCLQPSPSSHALLCCMLLLVVALHHPKLTTCMAVHTATTCGYSSCTTPSSCALAWTPHRLSAPAAAAASSRLNTVPLYCQPGAGCCGNKSRTQGPASRQQGGGQVERGRAAAYQHTQHPGTKD